MPLVGWSCQGFFGSWKQKRDGSAGPTLRRVPFFCTSSTYIRLDVSSNQEHTRHLDKTTPSHPIAGSRQSPSSRITSRGRRNPQHTPCWPRDCCGALVQRRQQQGRQLHPSSHQRHLLLASPRRRSTPVGVPSTARPPVAPSAPRSSSAASRPPGRSSRTAPRRASRTLGGAATRSSLSSRALPLPLCSTLPTRRRCP